MIFYFIQKTIIHEAISIVFLSNSYLSKNIAKKFFFMNIYRACVTSRCVNTETTYSKKIIEYFLIAKHR